MASGLALLLSNAGGNPEIISEGVNGYIQDPDDTEMLGDLVAAAVNAAVEEASKDYESRMGSITGGLEIPGLR